jgi:hypothetical protein
LTRKKSRLFGARILGVRRRGARVSGILAARASILRESRVNVNMKTP